MNINIYISCPTLQVFDLVVDGAIVGTRIPFEDQLVDALGMCSSIQLSLIHTPKPNITYT